VFRFQTVNFVVLATSDVPALNQKIQHQNPRILKHSVGRIEDPFEVFPLFTKQETIDNHLSAFSYQ